MSLRLATGCYSNRKRTEACEDWSENLCWREKRLANVPRPKALAANLDTLFIVSSCNHDFNPSRLERYLSLAVEASVTPVVVLSKADLCEDPIVLQQTAFALKTGLVVETVNAS